MNRRLPHGARQLAAAATVATAAVLGTLALPLPASAITTPGILSGTIAAAPSCLSYRVEGVCFFLRCKLVACWIETSIKISHYVPDVIVSTYNEPTFHPWADIGTVVATTMAAAGSALTGRLLDSSAGGLDTPSAMTNFKSADAIGNPAGMFASMLSGGSISMPSTLPVPTPVELAGFAAQELPNIGRQWTQVPQEVASTVASDARNMLNAPAQLLGSLQSIIKSIDGVRQAIEIADTVKQVDQSIDAIGQITGILGGATGGSMLFCPGGASMFTLHFQSELDAATWRSILPVELLYPQSWVPGLAEIGSGYSQTWGSVYPRTGEIIQPHPVKASAVLAERVASVIYKRNQPHIYTPVTPASGPVYFANDRYRWQMLHPTTASNCIQFGANDALSLASFGDGQTDGADGYAWNLWKHYVCCQRRGTYLFSVP